MIDEQLLRRIIREEIERSTEATDHLLTLPEAMEKYRCDRRLLLSLIRRGTLESSYRAKGRNGRPQHLVVAASAARHPQLGGAGK